ncbi:MAG TPA: phage major capsid protein [Geobacteraceae bacterium]|nr:phage major capsid protein [Geobacteraceae bacterium]
MKTQALKEKRSALLDKAQALADKAIAETRAMTTEENDQYKAAMSEAEALQTTIEAEERAATARAAIAAPTRPAIATDPAAENRAQKQDTEEYRSAFFDKLAGRPFEERALTVGDNGTLLPTSVYQEIMKSTGVSGGILAAKVRFVPPFVGTININTGNDTKKGHILNVATNPSTTSDPSSSGNKPMTMYPYTSDIIVVDKKLLSGSPADVQKYLSEILYERIWRAANEDMTTGTGTGEPEGALAGAGEGVVGASAADVTLDELIDLEHSVPAHLRSGAQFMFNDKTLKVLKKKKDADGNYLWQRGNVAQGVPNTFMGYEYVINDDMPDMGAGAKSILFGNFNRYHVAVSPNMFVDTVVDQYKANGQIGLFMHGEYAGALADNGTAIKYFKNAAA